ncbi:MAG: B12-binding domain-containing radical SAM protein [Dehalococcoidia bacterium]|nr:MAG: B12-binding domain-containing radical SAM protein [Dehalococcoidia bacterium]
MNKKLLLINPVQDARLSLGIVAPIRVPPIGLGYVAALTPSDWEIRIVDENVEHLSFEDADLVGITAYTSNAPRAYEIAEQYRRRGIRTVLGGVHASLLPDEAIQFVDSVVIGEAESVWPQVVRDSESNGLKHFYQGQLISLEECVKHRWDLYKLQEYHTKVHVETARGCPMDCEFCSVTTLYGRSYRQRPVEDVLSELEATDYRNLLFMDDNILGHGEIAEKRAIRLFRGMLERRLNKRWACQVGIDFATNSDVLKLAKKAGCLVAFIGFESLNDECLKSMNKVRNLKVGASNYKDVVRRIRDHGILVAGAFVLGGDGDMKDVFDRTTQFILDSKMDGAQISILTPLPGTRLYNRLKQEGRLLLTRYPSDWKHYGFTEAVFKPKHMTPDELEEGATRVYRDTCSMVKSFKRALNSAVQSRSSYGGVTMFSYNRGFRTFWLRNCWHIKDTRSSRIDDWQPDASLTSRESCDEEAISV